MAGAAVAAVLTMGSVVYIGRVLGPAEYADFAAASAIIFLAGLAMSPWIPAIARVAAGVPSPAAAHELRRGLLRKTFAAGTVAIVVAAALAWPVARWLHVRSAATVLLACVATISYVFVSIDRAFLQGLFQFRAYNTNVVIESIARAVITVIVMRFHATAAAAMLVWSLSMIVAQISCARSFDRSIPSIGADDAAWSQLSGMLRPLAILMIAIAVFQNTDLIAVKRWLPASSAGAYGAATALVRGFGVVFSPLYVLAGPILTRRYSSRGDVFKPTLAFAAGYVGLCAIPFAIILTAPRFLVTALYGAQFSAAAPILAPLAGATVITFAALMLAQSLITVGDYRFVKVHASFAVVQMIGLAIVHGSVSDVLRVLYAAQCAAAVVVIAFFAAARSRV